MKQQGKKSVRSNSRDLAKKKQKKVIATRSKKHKKEGVCETEDLSTKDVYLDGKHDLSGDKEDEYLAPDEDEGSLSVKVPFYQQFLPDAFEDSRDAAEDLFRLLLNPVPIKQFYGYVVLMPCVL